MKRYYVEYRLYKESHTDYFYMKAYSPEQIHEMMDVYELLFVDQVDQRRTNMRYNFVISYPDGKWYLENTIEGNEWIIQFEYEEQIYAFMKQLVETI